MHLSLDDQAAYAEGLLAPTEAHAAHEHLRQCLSCAAGVSDQLAAIHALSLLPTVPAGADGWNRLAAALGEPHSPTGPLPTAPRPRSWRDTWRRSRPWVSAAAVMVVMVGVSAQLGEDPAIMDAELDTYLREHHQFTHHANPTSHGLASVHALFATHRLRKDPP